MNPIKQTINIIVCSYSLLDAPRRSYDGLSSLSLSLYIYIYLCICIHTYIYIYMYTYNIYICAHIEIVVAFFVVNFFVLMELVTTEVLRGATRWKLFLQTSRTFLNRHVRDQIAGKPAFRGQIC